ncbi:uncharacterized protein LOC144119291 [Amblyomma americanum]
MNCSASAMKVARMWMRNKNKTSTTDGPVYVLKLRSPPRAYEEPAEPDVHFATWKKRVEGNNVIMFSIVVVLLIGVAVCFAFGTSSKSKAATFHYDRLTGFTVTRRKEATMRKQNAQETHVITKRTLTSSKTLKDGLGNESTQSDRDPMASPYTEKNTSSTAVPEDGTGHL